MLLRLLRGELALADHLLDERMVLGETLERAIVEAVGAAVADVRKRDLRGADVGGRQGRSHPGELRLVVRAREDLGVRRHRALSELARRIAPLADVEPFGEEIDGDLGGDLASLGPAHPIGHDEQGGLLEVCVLVAPPLAARVRAGELLGNAQHHESS